MLAVPPNAAVRDIVVERFSKNSFVPFFRIMKLGFEGIEDAVALKSAPVCLRVGEIKGI